MILNKKPSNNDYKTIGFYFIHNRMWKRDQVIESTYCDENVLEVLYTYKPQFFVPKVIDLCQIDALR